jgi:hypothetical protein
MNNKAIILAQHRHRLTKFDAVVITLALIFTAVVGGFSQSSLESEQLSSPETVTGVEARNLEHK